MNDKEPIQQIHELIQDNIPDCLEVIPSVEEEFRNCTHPPSFLYKLNQIILQVKSAIRDHKGTKPTNYFLELLATLKGNSKS